MKVYLELKLLSSKKWGDNSHKIKSCDKGKKQLYFDFYKNDDLSMKKKKKIARKK